MPSMTRNPSSSMTRVRLTASSPELARRTGVINFLLHQDRDEVEAEGEVDEVHRLDQAHDQEHDGLQPSLGLRLAGYPADGRIADQAVPHRRANGAATERDSGTDDRAGQLDRMFHVSFLPCLL